MLRLIVNTPGVQPAYLVELNEPGIPGAHRVVAVCQHRCDAESIVRCGNNFPHLLAVCRAVLDGYSLPDEIAEQLRAAIILATTEG